ncbi:MAG: SusE domain-containing protein [Leeuwenhoekiella sp.]
MKKNVIILISFIALLGFNSCQEEDTLEFTAQAPAEGVSFENSFASEYLLSAETETNIAERFIWNAIDFDAPVNITYDLEAAADIDFTTPEILGSTSETNQAITVEQLMTFAVAMGLDNDPETTNEEGVPNNTGEVYFRLHAYTGTGEANTVEVYSDVQPLTIRVVEKAPSNDSSCPSIYAVGEAVADFGWNFPGAEIFCDGDVLQAHVNFTTGNFRFFEEVDNWDSGIGYSYFEDQGYTIDSNFENSGDGDSNFTFVGTPGIYILTIDKTAKTITLEMSTPYYLVGDGVPSGWNWDNPVAVVETAAYMRTATLNFNSSGAFRIFTVKDDWNTGINYPTFEEMGYTIDPLLVNAEDGDSNFAFAGTNGSFTITINELEKTITLQ